MLPPCTAHVNINLQIPYKQHNAASSKLVTDQLQVSLQNAEYM